jgi:hypothetical protein
MSNVFATADFNFDVASLTGTAPVDLGDGLQLLTLVDGTKVFFDPLHRGKNVVFNGSAGDDKMQGTSATTPSTATPATIGSKVTTATTRWSAATAMTSCSAATATMS